MATKQDHVRKKRGRPPLKGQPKRSSFNTRIRTELKERLESAAGDAGRSLSEEIEFRLERSFREDDARVQEFGGRWAYELFRLLAAAARNVSARMGEDWLENEQAYDQVRLAIGVIMLSQPFRPRPVVGYGVPEGSTAGIDNLFDRGGLQAVVDELRDYADSLETAPQRHLDAIIREAMDKHGWED